MTSTPNGRPQTLDDRITAAFRKAVTRRSALQSALRWTLGTGTAMAVSLKWTTDAHASNCSYYGAVSTWGCYCAPTPACPSNLCSDGNVVAYHKRCNYWTQGNSRGQYCWCSNTCYTSGLGRYVCCDGYTNWSDQGCDRPGTKCICHWWIAA